jgi:chemotaxis protein CheX
VVGALKFSDANADWIHVADIGSLIRQAAPEVFTTMLAMDVAAGETVVSRRIQGNHPGGVIALLGLTGEWSGSGQISCEPEFACRIASTMLMAEYETVDEDVLDAFAEVANMIIGNVKNLLEAELGPMGLSTPTIVFGGEFDTRIAGSPERVVVPFSCGNDVLYVQIVSTPKGAGAGVRDRHLHHPVSA